MQIAILTFKGFYVIIYTERERNERRTATAIPKTFQEKVLDKPNEMCYNKSTKGKEIPKKTFGNYTKGLDKSSKVCYNINVKRVTT